MRLLTLAALFSVLPGGGTSIAAALRHPQQVRMMSRLYSANQISPDINSFSSSSSSSSSGSSSQDSRSGSGGLRTKVRQHVNPLSAKYREPVVLQADWKQAFKDPLLPLILDIGCAKGNWVLECGQLSSVNNFLGLEIRRPVVELALHRKVKRQADNVHFIACNANVDLVRICTEYSSSIDAVTIQFPDPHFKNTHKKRRVVTAELVNSIASILPVGSTLFVQSDVFDVCEAMVKIIDASPYFEPSAGCSSALDKLESNPNPFEVTTEREMVTLSKGLPVYRMHYIRNEREKDCV